MENIESKEKTSKRQAKIEQRRKEAQKESEKLNLAGTGRRVSSTRDPPQVISECTKINNGRDLQYCVVSFVAPDGARQRSKRVMIKFRGAFVSMNEADEYCKFLRSIDPDFDLHIFCMWEWIQVPPPAEQYESVEMKYMQEQLGPIMRQHYQQAVAGKLQVQNNLKKAKEEAKKKLTEADKERNKRIEKARLDEEAFRNTQQTSS